MITTEKAYIGYMMKVMMMQMLMGHRIKRALRERRYGKILVGDALPSIVKCISTIIPG